MNSEQVARYAGISYRQLDNWIRRGWIPDAPEAHGPGTQREFNHDHLSFLERMAALVKAGMYPEKAHRVAKGDEDAILRVVLAVQPCVGGELLYRPGPPGGVGVASPESPSSGQGAETGGSGVSQN